MRSWGKAGSVELKEKVKQQLARREMEACGAGRQAGEGGKRLATTMAAATAATAAMARRESEAGEERDLRDAHARERFMRESGGVDGAVRVWAVGCG